ncbi:MAG: hypothetical protein KAT65_27515 [Methanophagales archaeon]|nr:hypothetical protein [Methanophagales archaeon]
MKRESAKVSNKGNMNKVSARITTSTGIVIVLVLYLLLPTALAGIGVAPSTLEIKDAMRGVELERTIKVFNPGDEASGYTFDVSGEAGNWISFYEVGDPVTPIKKVTIPGEGSAMILVRFNIPEDASNRKHEATIFVATAAAEEDEDSSGQAIKLGAPVAVTITVTGTQILTGTVKSITTTDTEINYPLRIKVEFLNTGNVVTKPEIAVKITKNGTMIDRFTHRETWVKVNIKDIIPAEWDTSGKESGDYAANITVSLGGKVLATKELPFKLLPVGTLSRKGDLTCISCEGKPSVGKTLKILAPFANTGEIDTKAKLVGEVYVDGDLVDTLNGEELLVPMKETETLLAYLKIEQDGSYTIKGHAIYEGKTTETKELSFVVGTKAETEPTPNSIPGFGAIGVIIAIASVMGYLVYRRRKSEW